MTVLWVTFGLPYPPDSGVRMRDFYLIREVSRQARVLLFSLVPPGGVTEPGELRDFCARIDTWQMPAVCPPLHLLLRMPAGAWRNFFPEAAARIRAIALEEHPDVIQIEHSLLAGYLDAVPSELQCRTVLSLHNIGFEQYRRMAGIRCGIGKRAGYLIKSWIMRRTESHYIPRFKCCLAASDRDRDLVERAVPGVRPVVIENGVDCMAQKPLPRAGAVLLFAGVMNYPPNSDAAVFFCRSILPLVRASVPEVKLLIVGHAPPPQVMALGREPGVTVTGRVDDVRPYYAQASVSIVPLRAGSGTRLKILESMALGRPVVSTSIGCEGLDVEDGRPLLIADDPQQFVECVTRLLLDPALCDRIATEARGLVEQRYDWHAIGQRLVSTYSSI
ncbi:MAG: glycosyltransferase family 4 protein [Bryobacteraceae bacterium]